MDSEKFKMSKITKVPYQKILILKECDHLIFLKNASHKLFILDLLNEKMEGII